MTAAHNLVNNCTQTLTTITLGHFKSLGEYRCTLSFTQSQERRVKWQSKHKHPFQTLAMTKTIGE